MDPLTSMPVFGSVVRLGLMNVVVVLGGSVLGGSVLGGSVVGGSVVGGSVVGGSVVGGSVVGGSVVGGSVVGGSVVVVSTGLPLPQITKWLMFAVLSPAAGATSPVTTAGPTNGPK
jgi:hypothetical protein